MRGIIYYARMSPEAPKELDGDKFLVKVVIPARLKNVIMKQLEEKGITKEALLLM